MKATQASHAWTPARITTSLWLDAADISTIVKSGELVSTWIDKSGTGKNATQSGSARPAYLAAGLNGLPAIDFDGIDDDLELLNIAGFDVVDQSFFIVAKRDNRDGRYEIAFGVGDKTVGTGIADAPHWPDHGMYSQIGYLGNRPTPSSPITDSPYINAVIGGSIQYSYTNGTLVGIGPAQSTKNFSISSGGFIGSGRAFSDDKRFFDGKISELIVVPSVANLRLFRLIEGYLARKWGLTTNLPIVWP
jgi:hypothetical protein